MGVEGEANIEHRIMNNEVYELFLTARLQDCTTARLHDCKTAKL